MIDFQKALVISFSGTLLGMDNPNFDSIFTEIKQKVGLSTKEFEKYTEDLEVLINNMGIMAFSSFSSLSNYEKNKIKDVLKYALEKGNVKHIPQVQLLYNGVISFLN